MSQTYATLTCVRLLCAMCYCCQERLCLQHLKDYNDLVGSYLNQLSDQIYTVKNRFKLLDTKGIIGNCRQ